MAVEAEETLRSLMSRNSDRIKAILIIFVAADHNDWLRAFSPRLFEPLTFHVLGFFLLAFTFGANTLSFRFVLDRVARYLIPFLWVLTASSLAFAFAYKSQDGLSALFVKWLLAALIGNAPFVKSSSGLMMLWFMPCLFGLSCLIASFDSLKSNRVRYIAICLAVVVHLTIPLMPVAPMLWVPFGLAIAMDIFLLGLVWRKLIDLRLPALWGVMSLAVFVAAYTALVSVPVHLEIATLSLAGVSNPAVLFLQDISSMAGVLVVVWLASAPRQVPWLEMLGRNSLLVYLLHPFVYVVLGKVLGVSHRVNAAPLWLLLIGVLSTFFVVGVSYATSLVVTRSRVLSDWVTPRSMAKWPPVKQLTRVLHAR